MSGFILMFFLTQNKKKDFISIRYPLFTIIPGKILGQYAMFTARDASWFIKKIYRKTPDRYIGE
jgi:hypothetical protein